MSYDESALLDVPELYEDYLDESDDESDDEARRRPRRPGRGRPRTPDGRGLFQSRPRAEYVTQVQLQAAMDRVGTQIKQGSEATQAVASRANAIQARLDGEVAARKKETTQIRKDMGQAQQMSILPLLLQKPPEVTIPRLTVTSGQTSETQAVVKQSNDLMLPLLLMGGLGNAGGSGSGAGDNSMLLLLALAFSK